MLRPFEMQILTDINFVTRFINAINLCVKDPNSPYQLVNKDVKEVLLDTGYMFENVKSQYLSDVVERNFTFRLIFDIKGESVLPYMYVLKDGLFLSNGLSHFGYMLNSLT